MVSGGSVGGTTSCVSSYIGSSYSLARRDGRYHHADDDKSRNHRDSCPIWLGLLFAAALLTYLFITDNEKVTVLKLQVCLPGSARSVQRDLDRIAGTADTCTSEGLSSVLNATAQSLLSVPDYYISVDVSSDVKNSTMEWKETFNQLSAEESGKFREVTEESGKFGEVTLLNVNNIKKRSSKQKASEISNGYMVVTILVAADGVHELPTINSRTDLEEALRKLVSIPASKTEAVEVLWTPKLEDDVLTEEQLRKDYPLLRPLMS